MSKTLGISGTDFLYPENGEQNWGEEATGWAEAVTSVINTLAPVGFIPETTLDIADNATSFTNVTGASFDFSISNSFNLAYTVVRSDGVDTIAERGNIYGVYNGADWDYSIELVGDAGMVFEVTPAGQIRYTSSNLGGVYTGTMKFNANVITA